VTTEGSTEAAVEAATPLTERLPRCRACGAVQASPPAPKGRCKECRALLRVAADPIPRGPSGWCAHHPDNQVTGVCIRCGAFTCVHCEVSVRGIRYCEDCREELALQLAAPVAWEERKTIGSMVAWWRTTAEVTARPAQFFERMEPRGDLSAALGYGLAGSALQWSWQILLMGLYVLFIGVIGLIIAIAASAQSSSPGPGLAMMGVFAGMIVLLLATPGLNLAFVLVLAAFQHLALRLVGAGGEHGIGATLKIACYAMGVGWSGLIPYMGQMALPVWWAILMVVGTHKVHQCSVTRSLATLVPFVILFLSPIVAYFGLTVVAMVIEAL
jgi:hypothetical protein